MKRMGALLLFAAVAHADSESLRRERDPRYQMQMNAQRQQQQFFANPRANARVSDRGF